MRADGSTMKHCEAHPSGQQRQSAGRDLLDVLIFALCVCLLLALGVVLLRPQRPSLPSSSTPDTVLPDEDADEDADDGPRELTLGFALLTISLSVCLYAMYRMGFCCNRTAYNRARLGGGVLPSVESRLHLISDLPPRYDAIAMSPREPPPYFAVIGLQGDAHGLAAPGDRAASATASSRPQEAG